MTQAAVTEEVRAPMGWLIGRTQRCAKLLELPEVQELAARVIEHVDAFCAVEEIDPANLEVNVLPSRSLHYIRLRLGGRPCAVCQGSGKVAGAEYCPTCDGTGVR